MNNLVKALKWLVADDGRGFQHNLYERGFAAAAQLQAVKQAQSLPERVDFRTGTLKEGS